jgi:glycosyltransferase involved in cell wall biosynthesis
VRRLPANQRDKLRVIHQSVVMPAARPARRTFDVCVIGHLRPVKDPFRAAMASRTLPGESRVRILQVGRALSPGMARRATSEARRNPRYRWLGELPRWKARRVLAASRLMVISSRMEGGANVVGESIVAGVPILASRVAGNVGLLGPDYAGYFDLGDTSALKQLLTRAETDNVYLKQLARHCGRLRPRFAPHHERRAWQALLRDLRQHR